MSRRRAKADPGAATLRLMRTMTQLSMKAGTQAIKQANKTAAAKSKPPPGAGTWIKGHAIGAGGMRRYHLFRPHGVSIGERLPLLVMLHGCSQNARNFASSTRMNAVAARARALVLYPEQDLRFNPQGCWNWYDTKSGQANAEASTLMAAINQVCLFYPVDRKAVAVAGFSAGASMAALLASRHPDRFQAVAMHSGVPPGSAHSAASAVVAMGGLPRSSTSGGPQQWPPLLVIHGRKDRVVNVKNAHNAASLWASTLGAREGKPRTVQRGKRYASTITDFRVGRKVVVSLNEISELGHCWSGGDDKQRFSDAAGPDTSRMIWQFFKRQLPSVS
ncbi:extracellular catalytic domain type 1 short-chain-length polyhydroxyalkanoate depolymerase [Granulosicoccus sp. 3-233]|uniref:extracellular catalytic domain type 1 short-chain-length polyhydroxyalkanoate depolymerase n=1 Tax=Granulosicoccus sp. 3-233 TaxID=3417969 RepID=UPI003D34FCEF